MVGLRQAVALRRAGVATDQTLDQALADLEGHARVVADLIDRFAEHVLGDDPHALTGGEISPLGDIGGLDRYVHRRVAHAEDDDPLAGKHRVVEVGVGVQLNAGERVGARKRRFRPARLPVVAVGDDQRVVLARLAVLQPELPDAILAPAGVLDAGFE